LLRNVAARRQESGEYRFEARGQQRLMIATGGQDE